MNILKILEAQVTGQKGRDKCAKAGLWCFCLLKPPPQGLASALPWKMSSLVTDLPPLFALCLVALGG